MNAQAWQTVVSLGAVAMAASWWLRRVWRTWATPSSATPCGGCSGCSNNSAQTTAPPNAGFVPLASLEEIAVRHPTSPARLNTR
jgi:hypothetical protein